MYSLLCHQKGRVLYMWRLQLTQIGHCLLVLAGIICDFIEYLSRAHNSHLYSTVEYVEAGK